jgi:hypothetical protein
MYELKEYVNHSGGALGADTYWGEIGAKYGVRSNHYWCGERTPNGNFEITDVDYNEGRFEAAKAANWNYGYKYAAMKNNLLIRDWAQVKHSDAVFAIGRLAKEGEPLFPNQRNDDRLALRDTVQGGTGYAVAMAIIHNKPVHVFDQDKKQWYTYDNEEWRQTETPVLTKNFAGIGTRNLNYYGKRAIEDVYKKSAEKLSEQNE